MFPRKRGAPPVPSAAPLGEPCALHSTFPRIILLDFHTMGGRGAEGGGQAGGHREEETEMEDGGRDERRMWGEMSGIVCQPESRANRGSQQLRGKQMMVQMVSGRIRTRPPSPDSHPGPWTSFINSPCPWSPRRQPQSLPGNRMGRDGGHSSWGAAITAPGTASVLDPMRTALRIRLYGSQKPGGEGGL